MNIFLKYFLCLKILHRKEWNCQKVFLFQHLKFTKSKTLKHAYIYTYIYMKSNWIIHWIIIFQHYFLLSQYSDFSLNKHNYMYLCVCVFIYIYIYIYIHTHMNTYTYTNRYIHIHTYIYIYIYIYMFIFYTVRTSNQNSASI